MAADELEEPAAEGGPAAEVAGEEQLQGRESLVEEIEEGAEHLEQEVVAGVKAFAEKVEEEVSGIFGTRKSAATHGSQNAAISGLQTDADTGYVHPSQLPKE